MPQDSLPYAIFRYIVNKQRDMPGDEEEWKLPPMGELAEELGVSRGKLREELIAAQAYGIVEMRPGDGTYVLPFNFYEPARTMVLYGVERDHRSFDHFYKLRIQLEAAFWEESVRALDEEDHGKLTRIVNRAMGKLEEAPIEIPHAEHRDFHELLFSKLKNKYVQGLLKAYWDAYEAVGLNRYFEYSYYEHMWTSHRQIVEAIKAGQYAAGKEILVEHFTLLRDRLQGK